MRLIDADKFKEDLLKLWDYSTVDDITATTVLKQVISDLDNASTISAMDIAVFGYEVAKKENIKGQQGKWIFHKDYNESCRYGCNQCGNLNNIPSNFCPNCGARMKKIGGAE